MPGLIAEGRGWTRLAGPMPARVRPMGTCSAECERSAPANPFRPTSGPSESSSAPASAASRGWTRRGAGRSPDRSWRRPSCSTRRRSPKGIADSKLLARDAREADLRGAVPDSGDILRLRLGDGDRPHQHPAGDARRHAPRRAGLARPADAVLSTATSCRRPCRARRGRSSDGDAQMPVDRRRVDRRQGHPRPADDALRRRLCGLRPRLAQGLFHQGSTRRRSPSSAPAACTAAAFGASPRASSPCRNSFRLRES